MDSLERLWSNFLDTLVVIRLVPLCLILGFGFIICKYVIIYPLVFIFSKIFDFIDFIDRVKKKNKVR